MSLIPEDIITRVLERIDIAAFIGTYTPLKRAGRNYKGLCPFHHEKTPSFTVTPDKQIFHCFGCGVGGNVVSFVMKQERLEFPEAVRFLAEKAGVDIPVGGRDRTREDSAREKIFAANAIAVAYFHYNLIAGRGPLFDEAREYVKGRELNLDTVRRFQIGYATDSWDGLIHHLGQNGVEPAIIEKSGLVVPRADGKGCYDRFRGRLIFPIFDYRGRPVAFGARAMKKDDKVKYINSPETPVYVKGRNLYGFNWAKEDIGREDRVIIVEGYLDFIRPFLAGVENVAASQGTALTSDQIRLIRRYTQHVTMLFDMDKAGQSAALRSLDILLEEEMDVKVAALAEGDDPDSFIRTYGAEDFRRRVAQAKSLFDFKLECLSTEFGVDTPEGRGLVCREMLVTIEKVNNEVVKNAYLRELASRLNVSEDVVLRERQNMLKKQPGMPVRIVEEAVKPAITAEFSSDEEWLLRFVMADAAWLKKARERLAPEELPGQAARQVLTVAYRLLDEGRDTRPSALIVEFEDEALRQKLTAMASASPEVIDPATALKAFDGGIKTIRDRARKVRRQVLRGIIRKAEQTDDQE
ncbi:MAG: DNA primase, partial [Candidatus Omnitrophota bacterium]